MWLETWGGSTTLSLTIINLGNIKQVIMSTTLIMYIVPTCYTHYYMCIYAYYAPLVSKLTIVNQKSFQKGSQVGIN